MEHEVTSYLPNGISSGVDVTNNEENRLVEKFINQEEKSENAILNNPEAYFYIPSEQKIADGSSNCNTSDQLLNQTMPSHQDSQFSETCELSDHPYYMAKTINEEGHSVWDTTVTDDSLNESSFLPDLSLVPKKNLNESTQSLGDRSKTESVQIDESSVNLGIVNRDVSRFPDENSHWSANNTEAHDETQNEVNHPNYLATTIDPVNESILDSSRNNKTVIDASKCKNESNLNVTGKLHNKFF